MTRGVLLEASLLVGSAFEVEPVGDVHDDRVEDADTDDGDSDEQQCAFEGHGREGQCSQEAVAGVVTIQPPLRARRITQGTTRRA